MNTATFSDFAPILYGKKARVELVLNCQFEKEQTGTAILNGIAATAILAIYQLVW